MAFGDLGDESINSESDDGNEKQDPYDGYRSGSFKMGSKFP
jgi:hypothetical protein